MASVDATTSCDGHDSYSKEKLIFPAANRNKDAILQVLKRFIYAGNEEQSLFLEISSGSGQHIAHFAPAFPDITFQPSEVDLSLLPSISIYTKECPTKNIKSPIFIDVRESFKNFKLEENNLDYIYNANMMHISPYECTIGLFQNAGQYLKSDALLFTYGPFSKNGVIYPESNVSFDASLKTRDPRWGLRDINDLLKLAEENDICLIDTVEMPANNKTLIWKRN